MNREWKAKWIAALESGRYQQTREMLRRKEDSPDYPAGFCCLGVLADIQGLFEPGVNPYRGGDELLANECACGLSEDEQRVLATKNDSVGLSFPEIAKFIRDEIDDLDHTED